MMVFRGKKENYIERHLRIHALQSSKRDRKLKDDKRPRFHCPHCHKDIILDIDKIGHIRIVKEDQE